MVKPIRTFLLLIYIVGILAFLLLLPDELALPGEQTLKVPKITALFNYSQPEYADISDLKESFEVQSPIKEIPDSSAKDTVQKTPQKIYVPDPLSLNSELRIQYPPKNDTALHAFFRNLKLLEQKEDTLIRVVHFGDSQLEGDRITAFLRSKFQADFGGSGVGILNIVDKLHTKSTIFQNTKSPWIPHVAYGPGFRSANPKNYGIMGSFYTFQVPEEPAWTKSTVTYSKLPQSTPEQQKIENIKILYRNPEAPFELTLQTPEGGTILKEKIEISKKSKIFEYPIPQPFSQVEVGFATGSTSPEVYGIALDGEDGITFDNIALRGSSGVEFTRANRETLKSQLKELNVRFIIMQFGVNVVPNPLPDYTFYETMVYNQLEFIKSLVPNMSILVVGVSDMSRNISGAYESYPNIEKIRDAQRKAAFKADCAFWDLYEAMGGKNSMPSWVFENPPLANKDFTHFTSKGASIVSEMLYKALLTEYDRFNQLLN